MNPLWILLVGVIIVIGGILLLRLHAFLALILAALAVSALTPRMTVWKYSIDQTRIPVVAAEEDGNYLLVPYDSQKTYAGARLAVMRKPADIDAYERVATLSVGNNVAEVDGQKVIGVVNLHSGSDWYRHGDVLVNVRDLVSAEKLAKKTIGERVADSFGTTCGKIGILIAMAAIIGKCLLDSGAADRIVRSALRLFGERGAPAAFMSSGFLLGIPVFFDTVFYLMIPLGKALRMRTGRNYLLYVLTIVCGATMAHSLVPPTPGPLFVAEELGVNLGLMIIGGLIVGMFASMTGYVFALFANRRWELPLRESPDFSLKDLEAVAQRDESELPALWLSLMPIVLPVILIAGYTILDNFSERFDPRFLVVAKTLGNKNIALTISAAIAMLTLVLQKRTSRVELARAVQSALTSGGVIILITAAGGAFGKAMQQTGVASLIQDLPQASVPATLALAFLITTAVRTAQGSATVAMITAVGILAGIAGNLPFHPLYLGLAIGCGSKPLAWMNDSGFWIICKLSGMTEAEGLKYVTPMSAAMGVVGLLVTIAGAMLLPMAGS